MASGHCTVHLEESLPRPMNNLEANEFVLSQENYYFSFSFIFVRLSYGNERNPARYLDILRMLKQFTFFNFIECRKMPGNALKD